MTNYIESTIKAISPENVFVWDVLNEAIADPWDITSGNVVDTVNYFKKTHWTIVDDFVCKAFQAAKKANPKAKMFYNEYGLETDKWMTPK